MTLRQLVPAALSAAVLVLAAPAFADGQSDTGPSEFPPDPFPSTYHALPSVPTLIRHVTIYTGTGIEIDDGDVLMKDGKVAAVGKGLNVPAGVLVIDGSGKYVTPGIIDVHSHLGVYPSPAVDALSDGNELTNPDTAQVRAENSVWPQDPGFNTARAGGVTTLEILPGSGNLIGGRSVVLKNVPSVTTEGMKFPGAPYGLKMACGENPKRVYGSHGQFPSTLMGDVAGYRQAWADAEAYDREWKSWMKDKKGNPPARDLKMETLAEVLNGRVRVQMHCYRANEMATMLDVAKEFHYHIAAFHHAVESYKIPALLAANGTCAAMWADWWGFKMEAWDGVRENIPMVDAGGACAMIHSDDQNGIQRLNQEVAKAWAAGNRAGLHIDAARAVMWMTLNPAKALGIDELTGSLETGKMADVVLWNGDPLSVYAKAEKVYVDGALVYDRDDPKTQAHSDFELGMMGQTGGAQ
ncbi:MAG TPA: amidohydrolase [Gammaproteobacteria bacterium]|jgi:imidazolonepropionase-like amidohydrolase|nr:amidohydrolase [Gammaproteobacteria bacterium]